MNKKTLQNLERYRKKHKLSDTTLAEKLKVYRNYPLRWRKAGRIIGVYERIVEGFLNKENEKEKF